MMSKVKKSLVNLAVMSCFVGNRYGFSDLEDKGGAFYNSKGKRTKPQKKNKRGKK